MHHHSKSQCNLDDSGYFEQPKLDLDLHHQHYQSQNLSTTSDYSEYENNGQPERWFQKQVNVTQPHQEQQQSTKTWSETSAFCDQYVQSVWPQQTAWHNYGPLTYPSAMDQRCQEPMMFYS